jgi:hypothetical protein
MRLAGESPEVVSEVPHAHRPISRTSSGKSKEGHSATLFRVQDSTASQCTLKRTRTACRDVSQLRLAGTSPDPGLATSASWHATIPHRAGRY